jgi:signal transduction histidine kinase
MQTQLAPIAPDLAAFLIHERDALALAWAKLACQTRESHYRDTPLDRVQIWMARRLDAISLALTTGSFDVLDTRLTRIALLQLQRGFTIDEVIDGLLLAKEAVLPFIWDHAGGDAALVRRWTAQLDACLRHTVSRFGAQYAVVGMQQLRAQEQRTALMLEAAQTASSSLEIDQVLARIATSMAAAVGARDCGIYLLDTARNALVLRATTGSAADAPTSDHFPLDPAADPLLRAVLARRAPVVFPDDTDGTHDRAAHALAFDQSALLALPIIAPGNRLLGVAIVIGADVEHRFTGAQVALAWGIAHAVALAVDNAQLYTDLRRQLAESEGLQRITTALLRKLSLADVLEIVCSEALRLTGARGSSVVLLEDDDWLHLARSAGELTPAVDRLPVDGSLSGLAVRKRTPLLTNDPAHDRRLYHAWGEPTALLAAPLMVAGTVIGALDLMNKPGGFAAEDLRIVAILADQAAAAIQNARLHEQIEQLAAVAERQRLAHDLHDSVAQSLYSLTLYTEAAAGALGDGALETARAHLGEIQRIAQDALREMRLLIFNLHPPLLEREGLVAALQARLDAVEARAALRTELRFEGDEQLPLPVKEALYHIAQEALNNVLKHARAQHVVVQLTFGDTTTHLEIADDGRGFDVAAAVGGGGLGLRGMEERVQQLGGQLTIRSAPGAGTCITVEVAR